MRLCLLTISCKNGKVLTCYYVVTLSLQMAVVNLRDTTDKHGLQFQITIHGQNKIYTFQASTKEVRDMWKAEIRRLLQAQFSLMKGEERVDTKLGLLILAPLNFLVTPLT